MKNPLQLTPGEYEIAQVLWAHSLPLSVTEVLAVLKERKTVAYTTVMTLMDKMSHKGSVRRVKKGRAYFYSPLVKQPAVLSYLFSKFTDQYFNGHLEQLVDFVARNCLVERNENQNNSKRVDLNRASSKRRPSHLKTRHEETTIEKLDVCLL